MNLNNLNGIFFPTSTNSIPKFDNFGSILESLTTQEKQAALLTSSPIATKPSSSLHIKCTNNTNNINNNNNNTFKPFGVCNSKSSKSNNINMNNLPPVPPVSGNIGKMVNNNNKDVANVHYLWQCGVWTSSNQEINNFDENLLMAPKLAIIEPKTLENFNKLSNIYTPQSSLEPSLPCDKFEDTISVHSNNSYSTLSRRPSPSPSPCSSRYSSTSSQTCSISRAFVGRKVGSFKHYVFFSNRLTSILQRRLGHNGLGLDYQSLYQFEARKFQYSMLRGDIRFVKDYSYHNGNNNNNNGVRDYLIFKFGRAAEHSSLYAICERNDRQPERQPWCCQHVLSLEEMIQYFDINNLNMDAKLSFLKYLRISDETVNKSFDPNMDYNSNVAKITRMLQHGFYQFQKDLAARNNYYGRNRNSNAKLKNEDKFSYLSLIANNLGVRIESLLDLLGDAIEDAFLFARKYPKSALTQSYIDEEGGTISYELVLEAEIFDNIRCKYYKFAVPIVKCKNKQTKAYYYEAKNILTPKMAIDNIRLNSSNATLDTSTWVVNLNDWNSSYYRKICPMWFENIALARINSNVIHTINSINSINSFNINQNGLMVPMIQSNFGNFNNLTGLNNLNNSNNFANVGNIANGFGLSLNLIRSESSESNYSDYSSNKSRKTPRSQNSDDNINESENSSKMTINVSSDELSEVEVEADADDERSRSPSPSIDPRGPQFLNIDKNVELTQSHDEDNNHGDDENSEESEDDDEDDDDSTPPPALGTLRRGSIDDSDDDNKNEKSAFEFGNHIL